MATIAPATAQQRARAASLPVQPGPSGLPTRRRWGRIGAGAAVAVAGAWIAAALVMSAGSRTDVLVLADDVSRFETIERDDLRVASVAADSSVATVAAAELDAIVGRTAATDLRAGALLSTGQLVPDGERLVGPGEAIVGARLAPADAPLGDLARGVSILVIVRPAAGQDAEPETVEGWLLDLSEPDASTGERSASLVVPRGDSDVVAAAAGEKRVSIVALGE